MTTVLDDNVHNFGVDGSSDDLDVPIKVVIFVFIRNTKRMMILIKKKKIILIISWMDVPIKVVIFVTIIKRMMILIKKWIMMIIIMMTMVKHHYDN